MEIKAKIAIVTTPTAKGVNDSSINALSNPPIAAPIDIRIADVNAPAVPAISPIGNSAAEFRFGIINMNVDRTIAKSGIKTQNPGFPSSTIVTTRKSHENKTSDDEEKRSSYLIPSTTTNLPLSKAVIPNMIATTPKIIGN